MLLYSVGFVPYHSLIAFGRQVGVIDLGNNNGIDDMMRRSLSGGQYVHLDTLALLGLGLCSGRVYPQYYFVIFLR